ncbi:MAG: hypothetical protein JXB13_05995 [Phycisphaerae bacterium]|nr:hypothetical protein [Phycisphaerae bacterium]
MRETRVLSLVSVFGVGVLWFACGLVRLERLHAQSPIGWTWERGPEFWVIAAVVVGFAALVRFVPETRSTRGPNRCRHCDYDLTGNVSGRCPECGTEIKRE